MTNKPLWIPLHVHSEYSAYDGAIRIADYKEYAERNNLPAAAVTDHFTMSSFPEFDKQFSNSGIKRIYGNELYSGTLFANPSMAVPYKKKFHLNAFAMNKKGLINLQKLAAHGFKTHQGEAKGPYFITREGLEEYHKDIIFSSACISGELSVLLNAGREAEAVEWLRQVQRIVGKENFYIEILDIKYKEQEETNKKLLDFAQKNHVKTILTTDSHYMTGDEDWYNYLLAAQKRKRDSSSEDDLNPNQQKYFEITDKMDLSLRDPKVIWEKWKGTRYQESVEETVRLAERCEIFSVRGEKYLMPHKDFGEALSFREEAEQGLEKRLKDLGISNKEEYKDRLNRELTVITNMGFEDYFRFVSRLVKKCRNEGIYVGPGRGSAAGSVLTWSLGITQLDPLNFGLLFERFLNPERISMPDIDIDFEDDRRGDVIKMLKEDYGEQNVVAITNYSRCKWKIAIRDVMRVMKSSAGEGYYPWQSDAFVKLLEDKIDTGFDADTDEKNTESSDKNVTANDLIDCIKRKAKQLKPLGIELSDAEKILDIAGHFNNLIRNYGKHASGIVICPGPAQEYMPLGRVNGAVVTQYDMQGVDYSKLVKVDILGLSTLSMIHEMETSVNRISSDRAPTILHFMSLINQYGKTAKGELEGFEKQLCEIHKDFTPESIFAAYKIFCDAQTTGVFQFASAGMRKLLRKILPENMEDLSSAVALFRPGPLMSGIAENFAQGCLRERKQKDGKPISVQTDNKTESPINKLPAKAQDIIKKIAHDARGEMIYQEHIMGVAREIAGYSLGEADILRKAMGKKDKNLMAKEREKFITKAKDKGWEESDSSAVFDAIEYFAGYGFNKSHSFCYASLAFITAWYAANRPAVFWAALINDTAKKSSQDAAGQLTISPIIREAQNTINVYPPKMPTDEMVFNESKLTEINITKAQRITEAEVDWSRTNNQFAVFLGLSSVKGTGGSLTGLQRLASLELTKDDTIEDVFEKAVIKEGVAVTLGQASQYFRNGFFDTILQNTISHYKKENLLPIYVRLAIIELANTEYRDKDLCNKMVEATNSLLRKTRIERMIEEEHPFPIETKERAFPFKTIASRCVWGSFLSDAAERIWKKTKYKSNPWDEDKVKEWIENSLRPVIEALLKRAEEIKERMKTDVNFRIQKYLEIYRLEKHVYGESFTVPDWAMGAEMTGYTALFYPDMVNMVRYAANNKDSAPNVAKNKASDPIDYLLDENKGVWVLGQFGRARWNGEEKGGFIRLDGRYGPQTFPLYISVKQKLPLITLENMKKVSGQGGIVALRVWLDENRRFHLCNSSTNDIPAEFKAGLEGLPDSIVILPMMSETKYEFPLFLPYGREKPTIFEPWLKVADDKNIRILNNAMDIYQKALKQEKSLGKVIKNGRFAPAF